MDKVFQRLHDNVPSRPGGNTIYIYIYIDICFLRSLHPLFFHLPFVALENEKKKNTNFLVLATNFFEYN